MTQKHTPLPWQAEIKHIGQPIEIIGQRYVAQVYNHSIAGSMYAKENDALHGEAVANARLIAAAPEMLEALKSFVECGYIDLSANEWIYEEAKKAIAKAEGK